MSVRKTDLNALAFDDQFRTEVSIKPVEDKDEKRLRLRKEAVTFDVKDIGPYVGAGVFFLVALGYCILTLRDQSTSVADRAWAHQMISALAGSIAGAVFGRAAK